jgi:hypothetical protein
MTDGTAEKHSMMWLAEIETWVKFRCVREHDDRCMSDTKLASVDTPLV